MEARIDTVESAPAGRFLRIETSEDFRPFVRDARNFAGSVDDVRFRNRLIGALGGHRGFRRFLDVLHEEAGELERWYRFSRQRLWEKIAEYLESEGLSVTYEPLPPDRPQNETRRHLLAGVATFIDRAKRIAGVERVAMIGSLTTSKREPNNIDLLVTIGAKANIPEIATAGRKLSGHTQQINREAEVFLANSTGQYLGRTCPWRECAPGIRARCQAQHCGTYLYDDLHIITLPEPLIASPPLEIWPKVVVRGEVPADVLEAFGIGR
jgi:hypothetical protein